MKEQSSEEEFVKVMWFVMGLKWVLSPGHRAREGREQAKEQFITKPCTLGTLAGIFHLLSSLVLSIQATASFRFYF